MTGWYSWIDHQWSGKDRSGCWLLIVTIVTSYLHFLIFKIIFCNVAAYLAFEERAVIFLISNKVSQLDSRLFSPICFGWSNAIIICIHYAIYHKYSWGAYFPPIEHTVRCTLNMLTNRTIDYTREPVYWILAFFWLPFSH